MKNIYSLTFFLFISLLCNSLFAQQIESKNACTNGENTSTKLLLPIIYSYKDFSLRREDIYNSLNPKILNTEYISWRDQEPKKTKFDPESGMLEMHFCLSNWKEFDQPVTVKLKLGLTHIDISIRNSGLQIEKNGEFKTIIHPPVILLDQPAPNWMIPIRSRLSKTPEGDCVIDFQIYNPSSKGLIGPEVTMVATRRSTFLCAKAGPTYRSEVNFKLTKGSISAGGIEVISTEPKYQDPIVRTAIVEKNMCSFGTRVSVPLGEIPVIKPDEIVRFIYKVSGASLLNQSRIRLIFRNGRINPDTLGL